jgi:hypothetical protein
MQNGLDVKYGFANMCNRASIVLIPIAFLLIAFIVHQGGLTMGHIATAVFVSFGGITARRYLRADPKSSKRQTIAANVLAVVFTVLYVFQFLALVVQTRPVFVGLLGILIRIGAALIAIYTLVIVTKM